MRERFKIRTKAVFSVILALLAVSLLFTSCNQKSRYEKGFGYTFTPHSIMLGVRADTDTFDKNDLTLDIYYGVHDVGYDEKYGNDPRTGYRKEGYETLLFGLYLCDGEHILDIVNDMEIPDYKSIDKHYFIREISEEDAFSGAYGLEMSYLKGITYNHSESVSIPAELLDKSAGSFAVKLIAFCEPVSEGESYYTSTVGFIEFDYEAIDADSVRVIF